MARVSRHDASTWRILVVEDEVPVAVDLAQILRVMGFGIIGPATSLARGTDLLRSAAPDGALLDTDLGEPIYSLAQECLDRGIPIAFITTTGAADIPSDMQVVPRLTKPWTLRQLEDVLTTLFGQAWPG